jgi:hypothetical protein
MYFAALFFLIIYLVAIYYTLKWLTQFKIGVKPTIADFKKHGWVEVLYKKKEARDKMDSVS